MNSSKITLYLFLLVVMGMVFALFLLPAETRPKAVNGVLDLRDWDWAERGPLPIKGEWIFHEQVFIHPDRQRETLDSATGEILKVPGSWNRLHARAGRKNPGFGYGTYTLTILLGDTCPNLGFIFRDQSSAHTAFINGREMFSSGHPGTSKQGYHPSYATELVEYPPEADSVRLTLWVSNFHHWQGGAWEPVIVGQYDLMSRGWRREHLISFLVFGAMVIIGLYHLILAKIVNRNMAAFWLGVVCLLISTRVLTTGIRPIYQLIPDFDWEFMLKLVYVCLYLSISTAFYYFRSLFPQEVNRRFTITFAAVSALFALSALVLPTGIYTKGMPVFQVITMLVLVYGLWALTMALIRKREGSVLVLFSFGVIFLTTLNDILYSRDMIQSVYLVQYGVLVFSFTQTVIIARRFNSAFTTIANQRRELTESYTTIRESEERFQSLLRSMSDVVWFAQTDGGRILYVNAAAGEVYGKPLPRLMNTPDFWLEAVHPEDRECVLEKARELEDQGQVELEYRIVRPDKTELWLFDRRFLVRDENGRAVRVGSIASDVTARKTDEEERRRLEDQLRQAQKMEAVGTLAGGIAHDFNNILSAIMGFGELAQLAARKRGLKTTYLERIIDSADRGRKLVKQILAFSRKSNQELKPLNLNDLVMTTVKVLEHAIPKMVLIRTRLAPDLESVLADATQMEQVIMNLVNNACDAMPGGGRLTIETRSVFLAQDCEPDDPVGPTERFVQLIVTDTGQGMRQGTIKQIFDPFFTTKEIGRGTGLGLSTAYGIVKEHGGRITCSSEVGLGTTFRITLPALRERAWPEPPARPTGQAPGGSETLMLVDDEEVIRDLAGEILEGAGYRVLKAQSGEEALDLYREQGPEVALVVLDLGMPGMGGFKCLEELLVLDAKVKVLIASGYSAQGAIRDTLQQGASGYISKPFRRVDLLEKVRLIIDGPESHPGRN